MMSDSCCRTTLAPSEFLRIRDAAMRIRLNDWQWLGIVLSAIAFIGIAGYAANVLYYDDREDALQGKFAEVRRQCEEKLKDPADSQSSDETSVQIRRRCFREAHTRFLEYMFAVAFGAVVFCLLLSWFGIVVVMRWIRRGLA
jgi:hypothetical protein